MKVRFVREARQDLADIAHYLSQHDPLRARSYMLELRKACLELGGMPYAFEKTEDTSLPDFRRRLFLPYLIFYRVDGSQVQIIRIIHGARDYIRILARK